MRFYQRDKAGNPQFIGENGIGHTPMGSELTLSTGDAFDIYVQAEVESRQTITGAECENERPLAGRSTDGRSSARARRGRPSGARRCATR